MRAVVPRYVDRFVPLGGLAEPDRISAAIDEAGRIAEFDPQDADTVEAARRSEAQLLLIHGTDDAHIRARQSRDIYESAADHARLLIVKGADHHTIMTTRFGKRVSREAIAGFDQWLP